MPNELYSVLEVEPQASADQIRRAYFGLVRRFPPEKQPERFKTIRQAYDTLSDPKTRQSYDAMQAHGDEIADLYAQAETLIGEQKWQEATRLLKKLLVLAPTNASALNTLGLCYLNLERWEEAAKLYARLTQMEPEIAVYWMNYGAVFTEQADSAVNADNETLQAQLLTQARQQFERAVAIQAFNMQPYIATAKTFRQQRNYVAAQQWLEKALQADGKVDFSDFDVLFEMCVLHFFAGELDRVEQTAARIRAVVPEEKEAREYVAARFAQLAAQMVEANLHEPALPFLKTARSFDPEDEDIANFTQFVAKVAAIKQQTAQIRADALIVEPIRLLCSYYAADYFDEFDENDDKEALFSALWERLDDAPYQNTVASIQRLRAVYSSVYELNAVAFDKIQELAAAGTSSPAALPSSGVVSSSSSVTSATPASASNTAAPSINCALVVLALALGGAGVGAVLQHRSRQAQAVSALPAAASALPVDYARLDALTASTSQVKLQEADLTGKTAWELTLMRNEPFARHGLRFGGGNIYQYYSRFAWYHPTVDSSEQSQETIWDQQMSSLQKRNVQLILDYQNKHGLRMK